MNLVFSCSDDGTVRVWDFFSCREERVLRGHGADVKCVDWHPTQGLLASGSKGNHQFNTMIKSLSINPFYVPGCCNKCMICFIEL